MPIFLLIINNVQAWPIMQLALAKLPGSWNRKQINRRGNWKHAIICLLSPLESDRVIISDSNSDESLRKTTKSNRQNMHISIPSTHNHYNNYYYTHWRNKHLLLTLWLFYCQLNTWLNIQTTSLMGDLKRTILELILQMW